MAVPTERSARTIVLAKDHCKHNFKPDFDAIKLKPGQSHRICAVTKLG